MKTQTRSQKAKFILLAKAAMVALVGVMAVQAYGQPCCPVPTGIVGWWQGENNALDLTGNNNATLMNGAGFQTGKVNTAFHIDGVNDFVLVSVTNNVLDVGAGTGFTVEGWLNLTNANQQQIFCEWERVLGTGSGSDVGPDFFIQSDGRIESNIVDTSGGSHDFSTATNILSSGVWQHVALTYDTNSGIAVIYVNGAASAAQNFGTFRPQTTFTNILFGARTTFGSVGSPNTRLKGGMDEFSIYNRALYDCEIEAIYNSGTTGKCH